MQQLTKYVEVLQNSNLFIIRYKYLITACKPQILSQIYSWFSQKLFIPHKWENLGYRDQFRILFSGIKGSFSLSFLFHTPLSHDVVFPPSIFLFNITLYYNPFLPLIFINFLVLMICNFLFCDVHCYHENSNTSKNMISAQKYIHDNKTNRVIYYNSVLRLKLFLFSTVKMWLMSSRAIHVHFISTV